MRPTGSNCHSFMSQPRGRIKRIIITLTQESLKTRERNESGEFYCNADRGVDDAPSMKKRTTKIVFFCSEREKIDLI
jgi:hypothetical protein